MSPIVYVCILSNHNVPEAQAVQHLKPAHVLAVVSDFFRSGRRAGTLDQFRHACGAVSPQTLLTDTGTGLDGRTLRDAAEWVATTLRPLVQQHVDDGRRVVVHLTGGTKALTHALLRGLDGLAVEWHYLASAGGPPQLQAADPSGKPVSETEVAPLPTLVQAQLYSPGVRVVTPSQAPVPREVLDALYADVSQADSGYWSWSAWLGKLWFSGKKPRGKDIRIDGDRVWVPNQPDVDWPVSWLAAFGDLPLDGRPELDGDGVWLPTRKDAPFARWLAGEWYEQLAAAWLADLGVPERDILTNVEVRRPDSGDAADPGNELDVLFRHNGHLRLLEVKAGAQTHILKTAAANKLYTASQALGQAASAFLFTPLLGDPKPAFEAFERRAAALGLALLRGQEDLERWFRSPDALRTHLVALPEPKPPEAPPEPARPLGAYLDDIVKYASWSGPDGERSLHAACEACIADYPDRGADIDAAIAQGDVQKVVLETAYTLGRTVGAASPTAKSFLRDQARTQRVPIYRIKKSLAAGDKAGSRKRQTRQRQEQGRALSKVQPPRRRGAKQESAVQGTSALPKQLVQRATIQTLVPDGLHPSDLRGLAAAPAWTLLIDETGAIFETTTEERGQRGRFVGLLVPDDRHGLTPIPGWHATEVDDLDEHDRVLQAVLDAPVGVLGLQLQALEDAPGSRWVDGVMLLIDWVLRLMPVDGPTRLRVKVEQRGIHSHEADWSALAADAQRRLAAAWPERARQLHLDDLSLITKRGDGLNGYVDAVAFTWGSPAAASKARLKASQLAGTCLWTLDARSLRDTWEAFRRGRFLDAPTWQHLVRTPEAQVPSSLAHTLLQTLAAACRTDVSRWQVYLRTVQDHLESKAVQLGRLGAELAWLDHARPEGVALPAPVALAWHTSQLALANHEGRTTGPDAEAAHALSQALYEEDARLVCLADLHLAVAHTNAFDFSNARARLAPWADRDPAIPGRRLYGQVLSSRGQHAAFEGRPAAAVRTFDEAIAQFAALHDGGRLDRAQTATYRAIAMMDAPEHDLRSTRGALGAVRPAARNQRPLGSGPRSRRVLGRIDQVPPPHRAALACGPRRRRCPRGLRRPEGGLVDRQRPPVAPHRGLPGPPAAQRRAR